MNLLLVWGLLILLLGVIALLVPYYFTISTVIVIGAVLISSALFWALFNINARHKGAGGWLKPFILGLIGLIIVLFPQQTVLILAVFLLIYLLVDAFANLYLSVELKSMLSSWFLMVLNFIADLILAGIILYYLTKPKELATIFGIIVGVSLIIDGILAIWFGWRLKVYTEKYKNLIEG